MEIRSMTSLSARVVLATGLLSAACEDRPKGAPPPPQTSAAIPAAGAPSGAVSAPDKSAPWFVGTWSGSYDSQHYLIEMDRKQGGVSAWAQDEGQIGSGTGKLTLSIDESRVVRGQSSGPLGELVASGELDGEVLRVRLLAKDPAAENSFAGFLLAKRAGDRFEGRLHASTGDSATVRDAPVRLSLGDRAAAKPGSVAPSSSQ